MSFDRTRIASAIQAAAQTRNGLSESDAREVAFHMTDWLEDLARLWDFCQHPETASPADAKELLMEFLAHVPNHVAAAGKLLTGFGVSDIFHVGSVDTDEKPN